MSFKAVHNAILPEFEWSTGETTEYIEVDPNGIYSVTVTDKATSCISSAAIEIYNPIEDINELSILPSMPIYCKGSGEKLKLANKPNWVEKIVWYNPYDEAFEEEEYLIQEGGIHWLAVQSVSGCIYDILVEVADEIDISISVDPFGAEICESQNANPITLIATVIDYPTDNLTYTWSNGATTPSILVDEFGTYTLMVEDDKACKGDAGFVTPVCDEDPATIKLESCALGGNEL